MSKEMIVPIFIPHMGCRHVCVFCDQHKISGTESPIAPDEIFATVRSYRNSCRDIDAREVQIAFYGGSFTGIPQQIQESYLTEAQKLKAQGWIHKIRLSTRADYIDEVVLSRLQNYQVDIVELGVQSMDDDVLRQSKRGHTAEDVCNAVALLRQYGFSVGLQMMVALPGDTPEKSVETAKRIIALKPDFVRIYPTAIIKHTELAEMWEQGRYTPWDWEILIDTVAQIAALFEQASISIIRIGLQSTENLTLERDLLGGGYHPALGEIVKSRICRSQMEQILAECPNGAYEIRCHPRKLSQMKGQKGENIRYFAEKKQMRIYIRADETVALDEIIAAEIK